MIRRAAKTIVGKETRAHQLWKVVGSGISPHSRRTEDVQRQFVSPVLGHQNAREAPQAYVLVANTTGLRDHKWWIGSTTGSPVIPYHVAECSSCEWSLGTSGTIRDQGSSLLACCNRHVGTRVLSTETKQRDDTSKRSTSEQVETQIKEEAPARPKSIEDFQSEEIVGPTVERDLSDTAKQVRESLDKLIGVMSSLKTGFVLLGSVQLLAVLWSSFFQGVGLNLGLPQGLAIVMSFMLAYLLRLFGSRLEFFSKIEERGRMRVLTLSLMVNRMMTTCFLRSSFVVKTVAACSLLALIGNVSRSISL